MFNYDTSEILEANCADIERAQIAGTPDTVIDRLRLDTSRVDAMGEGLRQLVALTDPIGKIVEQWTRPNGLEIQVRVPLGVVAIIYEKQTQRHQRCLRTLLEIRQRCIPQRLFGCHRLQYCDARALREHHESRSAGRR